MSEHRLSKLQKWIMLELNTTKRITENGAAYIKTEDIYQGYYGLINHWGGHYPHTPYGDPAMSRKAHSAWPVVCTSLRRMMERGLIREGYYSYGKNIDFVHALGAYVLTDEGKKVAELLKLNFGIIGSEVNNKRKVKK